MRWRAGGDGRGGNARTIRAVALVAQVFAAGLCCTAGALAAEPPPITAITPLNGQALTPQGAITFEVSAPSGLGDVYLEVSSENSVGPEGRLLSTSRLERLSLQAKPGSGTYSGESAFTANLKGWSFTPGTYYWQAGGSYVEPSESLRFHIRELQSPVYTLVIAPPPTALSHPVEPVSPPQGPAGSPAAGLAISTAERLVSVMARKETGRSAAHVNAHCTRRTQGEVVCEARWLWAQTPAHINDYDGRFTFEAQTNEVRASFNGTRTRRGCVRRVGGKRCSVAVRWATTIPAMADASRVPLTARPSDAAAHARRSIP